MEIKSLKRPFPNLNIDDNSYLFDIEERFQCDNCKRSRKFFCYSCSKPNPNIIESPHVKLPFKIDIIKHKRELVGKSTSCHAKLISPEDVEIYEYPDIPDYKDQEGIVLIFVSPKAIDILSFLKGNKTLKVKENYGHQIGKKAPMLLKKKLSEIVVDEAKEEYERNEINNDFTLDNLPIKRAVFIDSTWSQCKSIFKDDRLKDLTTLIIQNRYTQFWRPNGNHPSWYLATIEAIHQFLFEFHVYAWGIEKSYLENSLQDLKLISTDWIPKDKIFETPNSDEERDKAIFPYCGQYDNLLYYFSFVYSLVHSKVKRFDNDEDKKDNIISSST